MITQEDLDRLTDRKVYVMETVGGKDILIATGGNLKKRQIYFLVTLLCYKDTEAFHVAKKIDRNSPCSGLFIGSIQDSKIRKPTVLEYLKFSKAMRDNKISYNKKTKEVKKL